MLASARPKQAGSIEEIARDWFAANASGSGGLTVTAPKEAAVTLTAAQTAIVAKALADAERYRRDTAAAWCANCQLHRTGPAPITSPTRPG